MDDKQLIRRTQATLSRLSVPVRVQTARDCIADPMPYLKDELMILDLKQAELRLSCPASLPGARDILMLAAALALPQELNDAEPVSEEELLRRGMLADIDEKQLLSCARQLQLSTGMRRSLFTFLTANPTQERFYDILSGIIPLDDSDALVQIDRQTVVLVKDLSEFDTMEEILQFGQALWDTLITDAACKLDVGISTSFSAITDLRRCYLESLEAISVGRRFRKDDGVFAYEQLFLERFLLEASPEVCKRYHEHLFSKENESVFNDEMMYTIDMFFSKDLNMSQTARQLYIHRNTLVYRLDKVQKATGINLRSFKDAVGFKILMELKHCAPRVEDQSME